MVTLPEEGDTMNLHEECRGAVFWTKSGEYRARLELYIPSLNAFECVLFGPDGEPAKTVRYQANGHPVHLNYRNVKSLTLTKHTAH